jgi:hypothetical protein
VFLPSGKYLSYNSVHFPAVTDHGTQRVMAWGAEGVSWTGGQNASRKVVTGLNTLDTFMFSASANGTITNKHVRQAGLTGGSVAITTDNSLTTTGRYLWVATGS